MNYTPIHRPDTGQFLGVLREDGLQIPRAVGNRDWEEFLAWNAAQAMSLSLSDIPAPQKRRPRDLSVLVTAISNLPAADRNRLQVAIAAHFLRNNPSFARALGIALDGDETDPTP